MNEITYPYIMYWSLSAVVIRQSTGEIVRDSENFLEYGKSAHEVKRKLTDKLKRAYPHPDNKVCIEACVVL